MTKAILTDIEGTTSSLSFVKDVLFPYARAHLADFVRQHGRESEIKALLDDARQIAGQALDNEQLIDQFTDWIDRDQKVTPLKSLQGLIWQDGYRQGAFTGHVYPDAAERLKHWHAKGYALYVYSSGSVYAQKLLFGHSEYGDLTPLFSGYFDTHIGSKQEAASYQAIARQLQLPAADILFLSDIEAELNAARAAGFDTYWLVRDHAIDQQAAHRQVKDFAAIPL
ncbi:MAG: acireductone synthase [Methylomonas sp.]|jgi:enolase-phosphatase E1|uniref:acireductone synthase n=1 Tax=Methylomonas sp. TaxID=418 RepID=UPI0025F8384C|nr:acireductone synthase [Methylomonas sp.]MCK9606846.1 acireductone synthase [Methylomonas sp.]